MQEHRHGRLARADYPDHPGSASAAGGLAERIRLLEASAQPTFWGYLGCELAEVAEGRAVIRLDIGPKHLNLMQIVHGGVIASLLDNAMGLVVMLDCPGERTVTAQMNVHYLRSAGGGTVTCEAELVHRSKRTLTLQARAADEHGELLAWGSGSFRRLG